METAQPIASSTLTYLLGHEDRSADRILQARACRLHHFVCALGDAVVDRDQLVEELGELDEDGVEPAILGSCLKSSRLPQFAPKSRV